MILLHRWVFPDFCPESWLNARGHWRAMQQRKRSEKRLMFDAFEESPYVPSEWPVTVIVTRYGPRWLDHHDNLPSCAKYIVDVLTRDLWGVTDRGAPGDPVFIKYNQEKTKMKQMVIEVCGGLEQHGVGTD